MEKSIQGTMCQFCENKVKFNNEWRCTVLSCDFNAIFAGEPLYMTPCGHSLEFCGSVTCKDSARCKRFHTRPLEYAN